jgi:alkaline phosphatase D
VARRRPVQKPASEIRFKNMLKGGNTMQCKNNHLRVWPLCVLIAVQAAWLARPALSQEAAPTASASEHNNWLDPSFWQSIDGKPVEESWEFDQHQIRLIHPRGGKGSLLSPALPSNFELVFQWKIGDKANTGIKYRVRQYGAQWLGIEYQIIDEPIPLTAASKGSTASIYDLVPPTLDKPLKPAGQWNESKIVARGDSLEHYLNGSLVAQTHTRGPTWDSQLAFSKFNEHPDFGRPQAGDRIMLTDHGGEVAFQNFHFLAVDNVPSTTELVAAPPQLGNAMRNSWADQDSIVLWTRTTARAEMVTDGPKFLSVSGAQEGELSRLRDADALLRAQVPAGVSLDQMFGACPGHAGEVRLSYFPKTKRNQLKTTDWSSTTADHDFSHQWRLEDLQPGTEYVTIVEARPIGATELTAVKRGGFRTAPLENVAAELTFCLTTCHDFLRRDDGPRGHKIYPSMVAIDPDFVVHAGDIEYYDKPDPWAMTVELMRFKWARIFSLPSNREFYNSRTTYFIKDDHDTLKNDCWVGQHYGSVSFEEGVRIFNEEQFPSHSPRYATVKWGQDLQIWMLEGRDFRSPNNQPDGPDKTILGSEQKEWLRTTLRDSTATFKLIFSPTPVVGPDRDNKKDNHANSTFEYEGKELRDLFSSLENVIVFCGDRHWQYASVDAKTGLWEFGCGPGSDTHELGWKEGDIRPVHQFLRVKGGFLSGELKRSDDQPQLTLRHHTVEGEEVSRFEFPQQFAKPK